MTTQLTALIPLPNPELGAILLIAGPDSLGAEVAAIDNASYYETWAYAVVNEYQIGDRVVYAALFHNLRPFGTYKVFGPGDEAPSGAFKKVTVPAGVVAQVTFVEPRKVTRRGQLDECTSISSGHRRNGITDSRRG